ncbi:30S ribosomal protein S7 [candidate division MSBL1 archaeon SCGC-AAA261G05]|uniref:Small ribosomal subunit protein uS7 n=2 Tax=candidate division MSBL1 TaxID=215777 RepID=A0A133V186_9EURY|nr:30S ribosomal protein S7 [candidate division MSBL1 archaeon SCGC-AAA261C02]KXB04190.1 30S ribosomal protein S7 [candidate division MSBL1 archaeon SCGC-AAA261G05]
MSPKYFDKWPTDDVKVTDRGLKRYISLDPKLVPHISGRHAEKQFGKSNVFIVERLLNKLMRSGPGKGKIGGKLIRGSKSCGKKHKAYRIVRQALEKIEDETGENPIQVLVNAIQNSAPREETTKISYGGITYHVAVDSAPQRRLDTALKNLVDGAYSSSFRSNQSMPDALAEELILASKSDMDSYAVSKKEETERIAKGAR